MLDANLEVAVGGQTRPLQEGRSVGHEGAFAAKMSHLVGVLLYFNGSIVQQGGLNVDSAGSLARKSRTLVG